MPVTVIRPVLTEEERAERMARVEACIADFWRKLKQIEAQNQEKARAEHLRDERQKQQCRKLCEICGEIFYAKSGAARYCENCRETGHDMARRRNLDRQNAKEHKKALRKYIAGVTYICDVCGRTICVHERIGKRQACDECLSKMGAAGLKVLMQRKCVDEEVIGDA